MTLPIHFTLPSGVGCLRKEKDRHDARRIITRAVWRGGRVVPGNLLRTVGTVNKSRSEETPSAKTFVGGSVVAAPMGPALTLKLNRARFKRSETLSAVLTLPSDKNAMAVERMRKEWHS